MLPFTRSAFDAIAARNRGGKANSSLHELVNGVALFLLTLEVIYVALAVVLFFLLR